MAASCGSPPPASRRSSAKPADGRWDSRWLATDGYWCVPAPAACWRWTRAAASSRRLSTRSTAGVCSSARTSPKCPTAQSFSPNRPAPSPMTTTWGRSLKPVARGSLFRRDPDGTVLTVVPGLYFANGVTPTADGSAVVIRRDAGTPAVEVLADRTEGRDGHTVGEQSARHARQPGPPAPTAASGAPWRHAGQPDGGPAGAGAADPPQGAVAAARPDAAEAGVR